MVKQVWFKSHLLFRNEASSFRGPASGADRACWSRNPFYAVGFCTVVCCERVQFDLIEKHVSSTDTCILMLSGWLSILQDFWFVLCVCVQHTSHTNNAVSGNNQQQDYKWWQFKLTFDLHWCVSSVVSYLLGGIFKVTCRGCRSGKKKRLLSQGSLVHAEV